MKIVHATYTGKGGWELRDYRGGWLAGDLATWADVVALCRHWGWSL